MRKLWQGNTYMPNNSIISRPAGPCTTGSAALPQLPLFMDSLSFREISMWPPEMKYLIVPQTGNLGKIVVVDIPILAALSVNMLNEYYRELNYFEIRWSGVSVSELYPEVLRRSTEIQNLSQGPDIVCVKCLKIRNSPHGALEYVKSCLTCVVYVKAESWKFQSLSLFRKHLPASREKRKMLDLTGRATQLGSTLQTDSLLSGSAPEAGSRTCLTVLLDSTRFTTICV